MTNYSKYWTPQKQKVYLKEWMKRKRQENPEFRTKLNERTKNWRKNRIKLESNKNFNKK